MPPDTVTPRGSRAIEARPDVNVSIEVGREWSWVDPDTEAEEVESWRICCFGKARGAEKPRDEETSARERATKADLIVYSLCEVKARISTRESMYAL